MLETLFDLTKKNTSKVIFVKSPIFNEKDGFSPLYCRLKNS